MRRIAILDHDNHVLYVEDIDENVLVNAYDGDEQKYIEDFYKLENYSWDWIVDICYYPDEDIPTITFPKHIHKRKDI